MMLDATPTKDNLPISFYDAKKLVPKLDLEVRKIDCCISGCMLFYNNEFGTSDGALEECKFCKSPRYQVRSKAINPYGMLSGWGMHGKMGCPHCMGNTKAFKLENGGKVCGLTVTAYSD
ncbi:hypothetical protein KIW84_034272 [Lathyrus oleraceus]|uniref:Uncharacterized protein n=1 Tax=Pisum sativum TaxID=3888 RepID=A0A9D4XZ38_PEA|nr:hypothetical protein KIW84_034272 [Pisum sativum]